MKKLVLIAFATLAFTGFSAQEQSSQRKNDIMGDPISLIAVPLVNISYEHLSSKNLGLGINFLSSFGDESSTQFSPFLRYYVSERRYASGFFIESFLPVLFTKSTYYNYEYSNSYMSSQGKSESSTDVGIGFGIGGKWVTSKNLVFEVSGGVARLFTTNEISENNLTGKYMLGIGYRF